MYNKFKLTVASIAVLTVAACTSPEDVAMNDSYQKYNSYAEQKRMDTIAEIAKQGEGGVIAAALLMQDALKGNNTTSAPRTNADRVLDGVKTVVPAMSNTLIGVGQIAATVYAADVQKDIAVTQSNNGKDVAINNSNNDATVTMQTNDTMSAISTATIVNPEVVNPQIVTNSVTTTTDKTSSNTVCAPDANGIIVCN